MPKPLQMKKFKRHDFSREIVARQSNLVGIDVVAAMKSAVLNASVGNAIVGSLPPAVIDQVNPTDVTAWTNWSRIFPLIAGSPSMHDIHQGYVGDCFYLAVLAMIALCHPGDIAGKLIRREAVDQYVCRYRRNGGDQLVRTNGDLPGSGGSNGQGCFIQSSTWAPICEKSYALERTGANTYASLGEGVVGSAMGDLGYSWAAVPPTAAGWAQVVAARNAGRMAVVATSSVKIIPLIDYHAEGVIDIVDGIVRIYNPWGFDGAGADADPNDGTVSIPLSQLTSANGIVAIYIETGYTPPDPWSGDRLVGDTNNDGRVDLTDLTTLANNWQKPTPLGPDAGDFDNNGVVDLTDETMLAADWQKQK